MALVVEDGTGRVDAESYASVATCDAYHASMGNAAWTGSTSVKESALRRATQYVDTRYLFRGEPMTTTQALEWPRIDVPGLADNAWPVTRLTEAVCELAARALAGNLYADQVGGQVKVEKIGPIEVEYFGSGIAGGQTGYTLVNKLLAPYTGGGDLSMRLERAS